MPNEHHNSLQEIALPTKAYSNIKELYSSDGKGEIGLCSLGSIVVDRIDSDEEYEEACYALLSLIDTTIDIMEYPFESLETTAKYRRSVGVGITNLAYMLAKNGLDYSTQESKDFIHSVAERHSFFLHKASLRLAKEKGKCEGMEVSKYKDGWLPIDTYNKSVDSVLTVGLKYDWEGLRKEIVENGGIRNSVLEAFMPVESSSQLTNTTNGLYPIRKLKVVKSSSTGRNVMIAPEADKVKYPLAFDVPSKDLIDMYAIVQKFCGQSISADFYVDLRGGKKVGSKELLQQFLYQTKMGLKTRYYMNSATGKEEDETQEQEKCAGGACTL